MQVRLRHNAPPAGRWSACQHKFPASLGCQSGGSCFSAACAQPRRTDTTSPACRADLTARGSRVSGGELRFAAAAPATRRVSRGRQHQPVRAPSQLACRRRRVTQSSKLWRAPPAGWPSSHTPPDTRRRTPCWRRAAPARRPAARRRRRWTWRCGGGCSCCAGAARGAFVPVAHCTAEFVRPSAPLTPPVLSPRTCWASSWAAAPAPACTRSPRSGPSQPCLWYARRRARKLYLLPTAQPPIGRPACALHRSAPTPGVASDG